VFRKGRILGFLLTAAFLWLVARNVDGVELAAAFRGADYRLIAPAALATFSGYLLRTFRWQRIVRPVAPLSFWSAFSIVLMGFAANNLLPARLGEVVRSYLLRRKTGARKTYGMATIILERICDGLTLIVFLGALSLLVPLPDWGQEVQLVSSLLFLGAAVAIVVLLMRESLVVRIADIVLGRFPARISGPPIRAIGVFISGLHALKSRRALALIIGVSVAVWLLEAGSYVLMASAFNVALQPFIVVLASIFLLVVVNLGIMLPSAPGYVGTFQFFAVMALGAFGVPKETALAVAISSHLMQYLLVTAIGIAFFLRENLAISGLERQAASEPDEEADPMPVGVK
jgi:uncharacterized protein (TIRG00374 family)